MNTVLRRHGFRFSIFLGDHDPPHVHAFGDGKMKIGLRGTDGRPYLMSAEGVKFVDARRALHAVEENQDVLLEQWSELHGRAD